MKRSAAAVWKGGLLVAAAHAACFSMALSLFLGEAGMTAESIDTRATVSLDKVDGGFAVTSSHLQTTVKIPNADEAAFDKAVDTAKKSDLEAAQRENHDGRQARVARG